MDLALYFVTSLPALAIGEVPPFDLSEFRRKCDGVLSGDELNALDALLSGTESEDPFVSAYLARETQLRNVAGRLRASAWGSDVRFSERMFSGYDVTFAKKISEAFTKANPLEKEMEIDRARFWMADELAGFGEFTAAHVFAYAVKLRICERWAQMTGEKGKEAIETVINDNDPDSKRDFS